MVLGGQCVMMPGHLSDARVACYQLGYGSGKPVHKDNLF